MQQSLNHRLEWNGTSKSRDSENRDCTVFGLLKVLYAVRRPIAKQPLVTMLSAVARKSHEFLFVARAMERFAAVQIILLLRFPNTGHPVSGCVSDHWVLRNFSHEPLNSSVAAGGWDTLLWLGHWSDTEQETVHTTHSSAPHCQTETVSFCRRCRNGAGQVSVTSELRVSRQATWVSVSGTLVALTHSGPRH